jgi:addiction module HigA family antidote
MSLQQHNPPHPGEFLRQVYIEPFSLVPNQLAKKLKVSPSTFIRLINLESDVSPEMALKLSKVFGRSPESWLLMQDNYNLNKAKDKVNLDEYEPIQFAS